MNFAEQYANLLKVIIKIDKPDNKLILKKVLFFSSPNICCPTLGFRFAKNRYQIFFFTRAKIRTNAINTTATITTMIE